MYYVVQNAAVCFSEGILDWHTWNICAALQDLFRNFLLMWVNWYWWNHFELLIFIQRERSSRVQGTRTALLLIHLSILLHWLITELFTFLFMNVTFINGCMVITTLSYLINMFLLLMQHVSILQSNYRVWYVVHCLTVSSVTNICQLIFNFQLLIDFNRNFPWWDSSMKQLMA